MEGSYIYINDSYVGHSGDGPRERGEMKHRAGSICWEAGTGLLLGRHRTKLARQVLGRGESVDAEEIEGMLKWLGKSMRRTKDKQEPIISRWGKDGLSWFRSMKGKREREAQRENL